jgi:hypothetical protein
MSELWRTPAEQEARPWKQRLPAGVLGAGDVQSRGMCRKEVRKGDPSTTHPKIGHPLFPFGIRTHLPPSNSPARQSAHADLTWRPAKTSIAWPVC